MLTFYTFWAVIFHILYAWGLVPNTWLIAVVVLIGSQIMNFIYPNYWKRFQPWSYKIYLFEIFFHVLPVVLVPYSMSLESVLFCVMSLLAYLVYHGRGIVKIYKNNRETMRKIWE